LAIVENVPSKENPNAVDHVHLWKMLYFKGHHKYPQFVMGEEPFWIRKNSWSQWEGSACTQSALIFLKFEGGGGGAFFHFSFVPNMFLSSSQCVPQGCSQ
jgi:hypothetical protein